MFSLYIKRLFSVVYVDNCFCAKEGGSVGVVEGGLWGEMSDFVLLKRVWSRIDEY